MGRKKNLLSEGEVDWVMAFLNQPDISYTTPGRKNNVYLGIFNKEKKFVSFVDNKRNFGHHKRFKAVGIFGR